MKRYCINFSVKSPQSQTSSGQGNCLGNTQHKSLFNDTCDVKHSGSSSDDKHCKPTYVDCSDKTKRLLNDVKNTESNERTNEETNSAVDVNDNDNWMNEMLSISSSSQPEETEADGCISLFDYEVNLSDGSIAYSEFSALNIREELTPSPMEDVNFNRNDEPKHEYMKNLDDFRETNYRINNYSELGK